jgi:hypothetical protein
MDRANELPGISHLPHHTRYGCCVSCTAGKGFIVLKADAYRGYSGHMVFSFTHFAVQHLKHNTAPCTMLVWLASEMGIMQMMLTL